MERINPPNIITYHKGSIFQCAAHALVNPVNTVGVMGKGLAKQFKDNYPLNYYSYLRAYELGQLQIGEVHLFRVNRSTYPHYIINFPTKRDWRHKSKLTYIQRGLNALVNCVHNNDIQSVALPALGCGEGGLNFHDVHALIKKYASLLPQVHWILCLPTETKT